jgi:voltage-gated potassium channel
MLYIFGLVGMSLAVHLLILQKITVNKNPVLSFINPNALLLLCLSLMIFFIPMLSVSYHSVAYSFLFSCIFLLSALSLQHVRKKILIALAVLLIIIIWIAFKINLPGLFLVSRIGQGLFFIYIIIRLIRQTATAKNINVRLIADSINGYLLVGVIYSMVVYSIARIQPAAYHFPEGNNGNTPDLMSKMFYYTFVTYTSTGYGDVTPMIPGTRSFATLISASGQLYIAIIIALLVGKFSSMGTKN